MSIPLCHLLEIRRAADILVENPVYPANAYTFPENCTVEEFLGRKPEFSRHLDLMKEMEMSKMKAKVFQYLSFDHQAVVRWDLSVITGLRTRAQEWTSEAVV
jgi:hypothetical protein